MSEATSYDIAIHRRAASELDKAPDATADTLRERIHTAAEHRDPTDYRHVEPLDVFDLLRVRADDYRALCTLAVPEFQVLLVDNRRRVYDRIDVAQQRGGLA